MSNMSDLDLTIKELKDAASSLVAVAESLTALFGLQEKISTEKVLLEAKQSTENPEAKPIALEQVRAVLAEKSRKGHTAEVRALLESHGASKLSEINSNEYPALLAKAASIGATGDIDE